MDEALPQEGLARFDEAGMTERVTTIGYYGLVSMTSNTFEVPLREGMQGPFPEH